MDAADTVDDVVSQPLEVSAPTQIILAGLGLFFAGCAALLLWRIMQTLYRPFRRAAGSKKPVKDVPAHLQLRQAPAVQRGQVPEGKSIKQLVKSSKQARGIQPVADAGSHHPLYLNTLKGHSDTVTGLAFSSDATLLATACDDRTIRLFKLGSDLNSSNITFRRHNLVRGLVDVAFGPSDQQLIALTKGSLDAASLNAFDLGGSGAFQPTWEIKNAHAGGAALTIAGSQTGILATCGQKTDFKLFSSTGKEVAALDSAGLTNHGVALSKNGQFVAAATFTADVKIYEIVYERSGEYRTTRKVMDLKGHSRQVSAVAFSPDSPCSRAVTASQDHTLRIWRLDVRYQQQEDPKCLVKVQQQLPAKCSYELLAYGAHSIIAGAYQKAVHMIDATSGTVLQTLADAHTPLSYLQWSPFPRRIGNEEAYVLATAGDRRVRLWRSPSDSALQS